MWGRPTSSTAGYRGRGRCGGGQHGKRASCASVWLVPSPQEVSRRQRPSLIPGELVPQLSIQSRPQSLGRPGVEVLGASSEVRTSRRGACPAPQAWRGAGGLGLAPVPSWAEPSAVWVELGGHPAEVVRLEGRTVPLCATLALPLPGYPPCLASPGLPSVSAQKSPHCRGLPQPPGIRATPLKSWTCPFLAQGPGACSQT